MTTQPTTNTRADYSSYQALETPSLYQSTAPSNIQDSRSKTERKVQDMVSRPRLSTMPFELLSPRTPQRPNQISRKNLKRESYEAEDIYELRSNYQFRKTFSMLSIHSAMKTSKEMAYFSRKMSSLFDDLRTVMNEFREHSPNYHSPRPTQSKGISTSHTIFSNFSDIFNKKRQLRKKQLEEIKICFSQAALKREVFFVPFCKALMKVQDSASTQEVQALPTSSLNKIHFLLIRFTKILDQSDHKKLHSKAQELIQLIEGELYARAKKIPTQERGSLYRKLYDFSNLRKDPDFLEAFLHFISHPMHNPEDAKFLSVYSTFIKKHRESKKQELSSTGISLTQTLQRKYSTLKQEDSKKVSLRDLINKGKQQLEIETLINIAKTLNIGSKELKEMNMRTAPLPLFSDVQRQVHNNIKHFCKADNDSPDDTFAGSDVLYHLLSELDTPIMTERERLEFLYKPKSKQI